MKPFHSHPPRRVVATVLVSTAALGVLAGCATGAPEPTESATASGLFDQTAADLLPEGTTEIHVASGPGYPPILDVGADGSTLSGSGPEEMRLIGEVLGVDVVFDDIKFDAVFPALQSGRTDAATMALGITAERLESVDFISDYYGGTSLLVAAGNPADISLDAMCGHTVAALTGSIYTDVYLPDFDAACAAAGDEPIDIVTFKTSPDAVLALSSGRVEATMTDLAPAVYQAAQSGGTMEALDANYNPSLWGIAVPKGSEFAPAIQAALNVLIEDGAYLENLEAFDVEVGAIDHAEIYTSADQLDEQ